MKITIGVIGAVFLTALRLAGADWYVSTTGNDTTGDGSAGSKYATLGKAFSVLSAGDTVYLENGTYTGNQTATVAGTSASRITVIGTNQLAIFSNTINCDQPYYTFKGITVFRLQADDNNNSHHIETIGCKFDGSTVISLYLHGTNNVAAFCTFTNLSTNVSATMFVSLSTGHSRIVSNYFTANGGHDCIRPNGDSNYISDNLFDGLISGSQAGNGDHADIVQLFTTSIDSPARYIFFERNLITNSYAQWANLEALTNSATGPSPSTNIHSLFFRNNVFVRSRFQINGYTPRIYAVHNTFVECLEVYGDTGIRIIGTAAKGYSHDSIVANNAFVRSFAYYQGPIAMTNSWADYNFTTFTNDASMSGFSETHGITGSYSPTAVLTDPLNGNYLPVSGGALVNAGTNLLSLVPLDYLGRERSATPTIGAYEYFAPSSVVEYVTTGRKGSRLYRTGASLHTTTPVTEPTADILWYKFNEGSGTTLTADVGPNGTTSAGTGYVTGADSVATHAFDFGGDCTSVSDSSVTYGVNVITVSFWSKNTAWETGDGTILSSKNDTTTANTWRIETVGSDDLLRFMNQGTTVGQYNVVTIPIPSNNTWHHFAVVFDASTAPGLTTVYLNGVAQSVTQGDALKDGTSNFAANAIRLGNLSGTSFFNGSLDDVRIYGSALSSGQIGAVYANPE